MTVRRAVTHLFLAFCLLFAQQAMALHALSHLGQATSDRQNPVAPDTQFCDECVLGAQLNDALLACIAQFSPAVPEYFEAVYATSIHLPQPLLAFSSRAPPTRL